MAIAVTGAEGQLGWEFCRQLGQRAAPLSRAQFDLSNPGQMERVLRDLHPEAVVNCAAYTLVDKAEAEPDLCEQINSTAVGELAKICTQLGCPLVQISTDYVFGANDVAGPHTEESTIHPQGVYARTKAAGEARAATCEKHIIVRTCGLYGHAVEKPNFVKTMLRLGHQRLLKIVADQHCTPSSVVDVAAAAIFLLDADAWGLYHVVNQGDTTWYGFATEIFRQTGREIELLPISTAEFGAPAPRPLDSRLDTSKYLATGGPAPQSWQLALGEYLKQLGAT